MNVTLDLPALAAGLREAPETPVDQDERDSISPYLLDTILPMLERGEYPGLKDIDFHQFDLYDPPRLADYLQKAGQRKYELGNFAQSLCELPPSRTAVRAFL